MLAGTLVCRQCGKCAPTMCSQRGQLASFFVLPVCMPPQSVATLHHPCTPTIPCLPAARAASAACCESSVPRCRPARSSRLPAAPAAPAGQPRRQAGPGLTKSCGGSMPSMRGACACWRGRGWAGQVLPGARATASSTRCGLEGRCRDTGVCCAASCLQSWSCQGETRIGRAAGVALHACSRPARSSSLPVMSHGLDRLPRKPSYLHPTAAPSSPRAGQAISLRGSAARRPAAGCRGCVARPPRRACLARQDWRSRTCGGAVPRSEAHQPGLALMDLMWEELEGAACAKHVKGAALA